MRAHSTRESERHGDECVAGRLCAYRRYFEGSRVFNFVDRVYEGFYGGFIGVLDLGKPQPGGMATRSQIPHRQ